METDVEVSGDRTGDPLLRKPHTCIGSQFHCSGFDFQCPVKKKSIYLTSVVPSVMKLVSREADGAPFTPLPL